MRCIATLLGATADDIGVQEYGVEVGDSLFVLLITERAKTPNVADSRSSSEDIAPRAANWRRSFTSYVGGSLHANGTLKSCEGRRLVDIVTSIGRAERRYGIAVLPVWVGHIVMRVAVARVPASCLRLIFRCLSS